MASAASCGECANIGNIVALLRALIMCFISRADVPSSRCEANGEVWWQISMLDHRKSVGDVGAMHAKVKPFKPS